mmetsp:Transcript_55072/g.154566  ORF Transcript_55072/g.154566 Transcript_55072/m.154566 type:complete len:279 (+) Transcript_55072:1230-2066(+)
MIETDAASGDVPTLPEHRNEFDDRDGARQLCHENVVMLGGGQVLRPTQAPLADLAVRVDAVFREQIFKFRGCVADGAFPRRPGRKEGARQNVTAGGRRRTDAVRDGEPHTLLRQDVHGRKVILSRTSTVSGEAAQRQRRRNHHSAGWRAAVQRVHWGSATPDLHGAIGVVEAHGPAWDEEGLPEAVAQLLDGAVVGKRDAAEVLEVEGAPDMAAEVGAHPSAGLLADVAVVDPELHRLQVAGECRRTGAHALFPTVLATHVGIGPPIAACCRWAGYRQ